MAITTTREGGQLRTTLAGELGHHEAIDIMARFAELVDRELPASVVLDLSGLSFMDSSGIAVIVQASRRCRDIGAAFAVEGTPRQAMRILKAAGIDRAVTFR